ncbi:hypothetical protein [Dyella caseinilytica]|uniref:Uncharacterized protein n=1 Tax=Dyella caseinilytica TaxID=1849581 RepID=A0ABX7GXJ2_9GAMM|nr:hypothetical protein [Dyella caseinilytica]QRN55208.1 hypothetical protein ISN74_07730 [Dyella caseinilytica]GGA00136.1 hypothetical protein GCM10011408_21210 [Dyella caseinilytica]
MKTPTPPSSEMMTRPTDKEILSMAERMQLRGFRSTETMLLQLLAERREREGYRWAPVEPTVAMLKAGGNYDAGDSYYDRNDICEEGAAEVWKLMLAAAPDGEAR